MTIPELYLQTESDVDGVAVMLRQRLGIPDRNKTPYQIDQRRESLSKGGLYYLFECPGYTIELLQNRGETLVKERAEWPYYLLVYPTDDTINAQALDDVVMGIISRLKETMMKVERDSLL